MSNIMRNSSAISIKKKVEVLVSKYCNAVLDNFKSEGYKRVTAKVLYKCGRKYFRVVIRQYVEGTFNNASNLAYIDFQGNVYADRGSKARYNIREKNCILLNSKFTDWAGDHLCMYTVKKYKRLYHNN